MIDGWYHLGVSKSMKVEKTRNEPLEYESRKIVWTAATEVCKDSIP